MQNRARAWAYTAVTVGLWGALLPGILIRDQEGGLHVPWQGGGLVIVGAVLLVAGTALVLSSAERLAASGAPLFGVRPGPRLVGDGWYARIRNPIDVGTTMISFAALAAVAVELMWVVPMAALVNFTVGAGLYEDRRLLESFGDDFEEYRARVPKWLPRLRSH